MSEGHARRAKPSPRGTAKNRRHLLLYAALPVALTLPAAAYVFLPGLFGSASEPIEDSIREMNFEPLLPPSRLRGPGAIYEVNGGFYRKVCDAGGDLLQGKIRTSPIPSQTRRKLENAGFKMEARIIEALNGTLGASRVASIEYRMSDAAISEIAMSDLYVIQSKLLSEPSCDRTVHHLLKQNKKICAGYAVLSASTSYKVNFNSAFATGAEAHPPAIQVVQRQIEVETKGEVKITGMHELVGQDLYYGIQLSSWCITAEDATEPSRLGAPPRPPAAQDGPGLSAQPNA
jgi:hypothetical protein